MFRPVILALGLSFATSLVPPAAAQPRGSTVGETTLPRRAALGLQLVPRPEGAGPGVLVDRVVPGLTAEHMGIRVGDVIVAAGGRAVTRVPEVVGYAASLVAGDMATLRVERAGRTSERRGRAIGRPLETYAGAAVRYGAVPFGGGLLRDILVVPEATRAVPIVFLLQGFTCGSIESYDADHSYRRLAERLVAAGIGFYRVEKPGVGDSAGGPRCADIDYATELAAFDAAYSRLVGHHGVAADRVFMLGHSLGGLEAPMLAAKRPPRGVAVYGTVLRNWADYHADVDRFQAFMMRGADPVEQTAEAERNREMLRRFFIAREAPAAIAAAHPDMAASMRAVLGWDGGERIMTGRHYRYLQDLAQLPLAAAWRDTRSNVLALYGESDIVALFDDDHRLIADIANHYRPGSGRYREIAGADHGMRTVGDRQAFRAATIAADEPPGGPFSAAVADTLIAWVRDAMAKPPVSLAPVVSPTVRP